MATFERFDFEGVEAVRVGRTNRLNTTCTLYRIGDTLIDTGPPNQWRHVRHFLQERDVAQVLLTHHHEDHGGNACRIAHAHHAKVYAHADGLPFYREGFPMKLYRRLVWGRPKKFEALELPGPIEAGPLVLKPIHTPGHAPDHVCFFESRRGWLFSGDAFISQRPRFLRMDENPNQEIESLKHLLTLHFDTIFCAHRGLVLGGYEAMREKLKYLVSMREQIRHYLKTGDSVGEVTRRLLGNEEFLAFFSGGDFCKRNYVEAFARALRYEQYRDVQEED